MLYQVAITRRAQNDITALTKTVLKEAPTRGVRWLNGLQNSIDSLEEMPERCGEAPESPGKRGDIIRELLYGTKPNTRRILFTVDLNSRIVFVLAVRHSRRQYAKGL